MICVGRSLHCRKPPEMLNVLEKKRLLENFLHSVRRAIKVNGNYVSILDNKQVHVYGFKICRPLRRIINRLILSFITNFHSFLISLCFLPLGPVKEIWAGFVNFPPIYYANLLRISRSPIKYTTTIFYVLFPRCNVKDLDLIKYILK